MKFKALLIFILSTVLSFSQNKIVDSHKPVLMSQSTPVKIVMPLAGRELLPVSLVVKEHINSRWLNYPTNFNALPVGKDPIIQTKSTRIPANPPIINIDSAISGVHTGGFPPDPTGAVGPNHYIHSYNSGFIIYDKQGNVLVDHNSLANIFPGETFGDPIVLYDRYADRFLITEFSNSPNGFLLAVGLGPDPVNDGWATYRFNTGNFPDYPKFSVWHDGYYITANKSGKSLFVAERDAMLVAEETAQFVEFDLPTVGLGNGSNPNTVFSALPMNSVGPNLPSGNTPGYVVYLQDDAWDGITVDHLKIWEIHMDWNDINNSSVSDPFQLNTTPFDAFLAAFGSGEVPQPGTSQRLDGQTGIVSQMCNYWAFDDHNAVTLNFNVDVSGNNTRTGIRWYELRDNDGNWTIEQEGTFAPNDGKSRFMGSMSMDHFGNIGLGYSRGSSTEFASLYFTGRFANDPAGEMTVDEELIVAGTGSQTNINRFGDYAHLTLDPINDKTFWFTSQYLRPSSYRTRIASFQIAPFTTNDVGIVSIDQPIDATFTNAEEVTVTIFNFGEDPQSNIPVSLSLDGTLIASEIFMGTIAPSSTAQYTFDAVLDLSVFLQTYTISSSTNMSGDDDTHNDDASKQVTHINPNDIGVTAIISPTSNTGLNNEVITIEITNFGGEEKSNFDVSYTIDNNTPVIGNVSQTVGINSTITYSFVIPGDFTTQGSYSLSSKTLLNGDIDVTNDETSTVIRNIDCIPAALPQGTEQGCNVDGIKKFSLGTINVDNGANGCNTEGGSDILGYADRTNLSTNLDRSSPIAFVRVQQNWDGGNNGPEQFSMWIDFNDNGLFEPTEQILSAETFSIDNALVTFTFNTPNDANLGSHILRARCIDTSSTPGDPNDPCADYHFGETHDYTVNIIDSILSLEDQFLNNSEMTIASLDNNTFKVSLPTTQFTDELVITLHNAIGQKLVRNRVNNVNGSYDYTLKLDGLSSGVYLVRLGTSKFGKVKRIIVK